MAKSSSGPRNTTDTSHLYWNTYTKMYTNIGIPMAKIIIYTLVSNAFSMLLHDIPLLRNSLGHGQAIVLMPCHWRAECKCIQLELDWERFSKWSSIAMQRLLKTSSFCAVQHNLDTIIHITKCKCLVWVDNKTNYLSFRRENYARTNYVR